MANTHVHRSAPTTGRALRARAALLVVATAAALATLLSSAPAPAQARPADPGDVLVNQADRPGDVKFFMRYPGPTKAARRSVDLLGFSIVRQDGGIQMTVKLKRILAKNKGYDQVIEVQMTPSDSESYVWFDDVTMSGQRPTESYVSFSPDLDGDHLQSCGPLTATVDPVRRTLSLFVLDTCLPPTAARIKVFSSLGHYRAEGVGYSLDRMKIKGDHVLK